LEILVLRTYRGSCHCICRRTRFWPAVAAPDKRRGVRAFGVGNDTPIGKMYGVNLGCLVDATDEELSKVPITYVDGLRDEQSAPTFFTHL
jgi:hypothetical protein